MSAIGTPHSPNPPTASVAPSEMSATASCAEATTLSMVLPSVRTRGVPVSLPAATGPTCGHHWAEWLGELPRPGEPLAGHGPDLPQVPRHHAHLRAQRRARRPVL